MKWTIPGTVLREELTDAAHIEQQFAAMFLAGDMMLGQVAKLTGLEPHTVQNWVKRGFLSPPVRKRYTLRQLCRILNINMLKSVLPMEQICGLLGYINGHLDDESDDLIDDSQLYFLFIRLAAYHRQMDDPYGQENYLEQVLQAYEEPVPGARERVARALRIMLTAWASARLRQKTEQLVLELKQDMKGVYKQ